MQGDANGEDVGPLLEGANTVPHAAGQDYSSPTPIPSIAGGAVLAVRNGVSRETP